MELFVYKALIDNTERELVSPIEQKSVFKNGLYSKSVIGYIKDTKRNQLTPDNIIYNPIFLNLFWKVIEQAALQSGDLIYVAKNQQKGFIYIIDQRATDKINTKSCDILGAFEVDDGVITPDSFQANGNYEIISKDGAFKLPKVYEQNLLTAMTEEA